jgi:DNA-binding transcriptional ArsR family regulator
MSEISDITAIFDLGTRAMAVVEKNPDAFAALAHPMRRRLLMELRTGARTASELAADMPIGRPAVAEHLQVLRLAGLVRSERRGRERHYHFDPRPLTDVGSWLNVMLAFWARRLEDIDAVSKREGAT